MAEETGSSPNPTTVSIAALQAENARLAGELAAERARRVAVGEILQVIASSPRDVQPTLDTIVTQAERLLDVPGASLYLVEGDKAVLRARGPRARSQPRGGPIGTSLPISDGFPSGRALLERRTIHIRDVQSEPPEVTGTGGLLRQMGIRTYLAVPMIREGMALGTVIVRRYEVRPFTEEEIALLEAFADQAVIAIENTRLLTELQQRLEEQTATAEILRAISESPTNLAAILDSIVKRAGRLCGASDCFVLVAAPDGVRIMAAAGPMAAAFSTAYENRPIFPVSRRSVTGRAMVERRTIRVDDIGPLLDSEYPDAHDGHDNFGTRSYVAVPLLRSDALLGAITSIRTEVRPFSDRDVGLLQSFADRAVIAIENARLLTELQNRTQELTHSVERLKAVLEVGQVVSSTLDVEAVLNTISAHAATLSGADGGAIFELDPATQQLNLRSSYNQSSELLTVLRQAPLHVGEGAGGRAVATRQAVQIPDAAVEGAYQSSVREILLQSGFRALLAVPLLHESQVLGALVLNRKTPGEFAPEVVELVKTFASQSAISLQNARLFQELAAKGRELAAASQHKSEFLATMSHELRTPLNAVIGMTGILLDTGLDQRQREYATIIRNSGETLLTIINDILDFSKIEAGKLDLEMRPFDLRECVESTLDLVTAEAARKGLDLAYHLDEQTPTAIVGDVTRLRQVLLNLLNNAVKFTSTGEVFLAVDRQPATDPTSPTAPDDGHCELHFAVRDTGIGIPADRLNRLFQPFMQADASTTRKYGGTGLGLAVSKRLTELMNGTMWVESAVGQGSTFHFTIKAEAAPGELRPAARLQPVSLVGKRLLVVDDNATNRRIVQLQARSWGMLARDTESPREALAWVQRGDPFDVAILDMQMPELDGLALAREIRALRAGRALPLVLLSSLGRPEAAAEPDLFASRLTKPIKPSTLYDALAGIFVTPGDDLTTTQRRDGTSGGNAFPGVPSGSLSQPGPGISDTLAVRVPLRILLAEDNSVNQQLALLLLGRMGYRADVAANGLETLEAVERQPYDVILMDVQMPEMDGLEASRQLCQRYSAENRPRIIAMTANAMQGDREMCLARGWTITSANPFATKSSPKRWRDRSPAIHPGVQTVSPTARE